MKASSHTRRNHIARQGRAGSGLCIGCALQRHDFKEITGIARDDGHFSTPPMPQARIDGIRHVLRRAVDGCDTCDDCGRYVTNIYIPVK